MLTFLVIFASSLTAFAEDPMFDVPVYEGEYKCHFYYDDANGEFDGYVNVVTQGYGYTQEIADEKAKNECAGLIKEFYQTYFPDAVHNMNQQQANN